VEAGHLTVVSRSTVDGPHSQADSIFALDNLLNLRSALIPPTTESNHATWDKYRQLFRSYEWRSVVSVFEQTRVFCSAYGKTDWSVECKAAEEHLKRL